ncbi:MAG: aminotransferase class III-fold pyridoxal phosphate-dependent enzyme [Pseudomonadota bacterium]
MANIHDADYVRVSNSLTAAIADELEAYKESHAESGRRIATAGQFMPGGNTRTGLYYPPFPVIMAKGDGAELDDVDGNKYFDFCSDYTSAIYGHNNPAILDAISTALADGLQFGAGNQYEHLLSELICERYPAIDLVRFCNSGSEANLYAIATAQIITSRKKIMAVNGAYHGGMLCWAAGKTVGDNLDNEKIPNAPFDVVLTEWNDIEGTAALIHEHKDDLAAFIIDPVMSYSGSPARDAYIRAVRDITRENDVLMIVDEVMAARYGPQGYHGYLGIKPDLVTLGKFHGGGFSSGAFGGAEHIMKRFNPSAADYIAHSGTNNNNIASMAAGYAGLSQVFTPDAAAALTKKGEELTARLNAVAERHGAPAQACGMCSIITFLFSDRPVNTAEDMLHVNEDLMTLFYIWMLNRGIYMMTRGCMSLSVALEERHYDRLVDLFDQFLTDHKAIIAAEFQ